jgi:hypothetical protein
MNDFQTIADMSEPSSLYLRAHLSRNAFESYLRSPMAVPSDFDDWMTWLSEIEFNDGPATPAWIKRISAEMADRLGLVDDGIAIWRDLDWSCTRSVYDEKTEVWQLGILQFSENIFEYLTNLPFLRAVCQFQDRHADDFLIVLPHLWSPGVCELCIDLRPGASHVATLASEARLTEAAEFLNALIPTEVD